jgi:hypothetical protein
MGTRHLYWILTDPSFAVRQRNSQRNYFKRIRCSEQQTKVSAGKCICKPERIGKNVFRPPEARKKLYVLVNKKLYAVQKYVASNWKKKGRNLYPTKEEIIKNIFSTIRKVRRNSTAVQTTNMYIVVRRSCRVYTVYLHFYPNYSEFVMEIYLTLWHQTVAPDRGAAADSLPSWRCGRVAAAATRDSAPAAGRRLLRESRRRRRRRLAASRRRHDWNRAETPRRRD